MVEQDGQGQSISIGDGQQLVPDTPTTPMAQVFDGIGNKVLQDRIDDNKNQKSDGIDISLDESLVTFAKSIMKRVRDDKDIIIAIDGERGCQPAGSKVLMADGTWKNIEDIKIGDIVLSPQHDGNNLFAAITQTYSWFSNENYIVTETKGKQKQLYRCSYNHLIPINKYNNRHKGSDMKTYHYSAKHLSESTIDKVRNGNMTGITSFEIKNFLGRSNCELEPYTLGVWLGDGHFVNSQIGITSACQEIMNEILSFHQPMKIYDKKGTPAKQYRFSLKSEFGEQLIRLGLRNKKSGDKFIPREALLSDSNYRKRLLAGLIDTDGYLAAHSSKKNRAERRSINRMNSVLFCKWGNGIRISYSYTTKSEQLAKDISELVYSLGGRASITPITKSIRKRGFIGRYFNISIYMGEKIKDIPFKNPKKNRTYHSYSYLSSNRAAIITKPIEGSMVYGFSIDSPSHWYVTDNWYVTHNSGKSTLAIKLAKLIDKEFTLEKNVIFQPTAQEVKGKIIGLPKYSVIILDESIRALYRQEWNTRGQRTLNKFFDLARKENKIVLFCLPRFWDLNEKMRNDAVKFWVRVYMRGRAFVRRKTDNPDAYEPWEQKRNYKTIEKFFGIYRTTTFSPDFIAKVSSRISGFVFAFSFADLTLSEKIEYERLKDLHAYEGLDEELEGERNPWKDKAIDYSRLLHEQFGVPILVLAALHEKDPSHFNKEMVVARGSGNDITAIYNRIVTKKKRFSENTTDA